MATGAAARVTVVFALDVEWSPWRDRHAFRLVSTGPVSAGLGSAGPVSAGPVSAGPVSAGTVTPGPITASSGEGRPDFPTHTARIGETDVRVITCGIGPARAAACAPMALAGPVDALFVCGFAGGLRDSLRATQVIAARAVHAESARAQVRGDDRLLALAERSGATIVGSQLTVDRVITTAAEKRRLGRDHDIVDMESFPLLTAAAEAGIPAAALRVVSDTATEDIAPEVLRALHPDGSVEPRRFVRAALARPWRWPALWRMLGVHGAARTQLTNVLDRTVAGL